MMPAIRATPKTSPFLARFSRMRVAATELENWTLQTAVAVRLETSLDDIDTICAFPDVFRCVRLGFKEQPLLEGVVFGGGSIEGRRELVENRCGVAGTLFLGSSRLRGTCFH